MTLQDFRGQGPPADTGTFQSPASILIFRAVFSGTAYFYAVRQGDRGWVFVAPPSVNAATVIQAVITAVSTGTGAVYKIHLKDLGTVTTAQLAGTKPDMIILDGHGTTLNPAGVYEPMDFITVFPDGDLVFVDRNGHRHDVNLERSCPFTDFSIYFDDLGPVFTSADLGLVEWEDCAVIRGHDGRWFLFLDNLGGGGTPPNQNLYCVRADDPFFTLNRTILGSVYVQNSIRVANIMYSRFHDSYFASLWSNNRIYTVQTTRANFPAGWGALTMIMNFNIWGAPFDNTAVWAGYLHSMGDTWILEYSMLSVALRRTGIGTGSAHAMPAQMYIMKHGAGNHGQDLRGRLTLPNSRLKLYFAEAQSGGRWRIYTGVGDYTDDIYASFSQTEFYAPVALDVANPNTVTWLYYPYSALLYFNSAPAGTNAFNTQRVGRVLLLPTPSKGG